MTSEVIRLVEKYLRERWSPEQIAGVLAANGIPISYESIYVHVWRNKKAGGDLYTRLRRRGKKYNYHGAKTAGRGCIPNRVGIEERPAIVEKKCRLGDWEGDTIIGAKQSGVILSLVDRKSKFTLLEKMEGKYADQVPKRVQSAFKRVPRQIQHQTITFDNGKEFSAHQKIAKMAGIRQCYFATPYRSCDRGLNGRVGRRNYPRSLSQNGA
jgi:IS30 family transposase